MSTDRLRSTDVIFIDDEVFPYRIPFFRHVLNLFPRAQFWFCRLSTSARPWGPPSLGALPHRVLPSMTLRMAQAGRDMPRRIHLTPTLPLDLVRNGPAVVVGYANSLPAWISFLYTRVFNRAFLSWATDTIYTESQLGYLQRLSRRLLVPGADACLTASPDGRLRFERYGSPPEKIFTIGHAAEVSSFGRRVRIARAKEDHFASRLGLTDPVLLYSGALVKLKNVAALIEALPSVLEVHPQATLLIVGDGPEGDALRSLTRQAAVDDNVHFTGVVPPEGMHEVYASADVFLFPTLSDTFGAVVGEAAAAGLPIICSARAGAASLLVEEGTNGYIVAQPDPASITQAILRILQSQERLQNMGRASLSIAERHSPSRAARNFANAVEFALRDR